MEDECLNELPDCLFLQEHHARNKEVWATAKHSCHSQPIKRFLFISVIIIIIMLINRLLFIQSKYTTDNTKSW